MIHDLFIIFPVNSLILTWNWCTSCEWISAESCVTRTNGTVIDDNTLSTDTTRTGAWINAFLIDAREFRWTFCTCKTFRSTSWRTTDVIRLTSTNCLTINFSTLTIWSTRRWIADVSLILG